MQAFLGEVGPGVSPAFSHHLDVAVNIVWHSNNTGGGGAETLKSGIYSVEEELYFIWGKGTCGDEKVSI